MLRVGLHGVRAVVMLLGLQAVVALWRIQPASAVEDLLVSYAGPTVTFLPAEVARQRGFLREQNLDIKLLLTRSEVDRAALVSGNVDYTLRAGSSFVSAARGLPVRIVFLGTMRPFWGLVVRPEVKFCPRAEGKIDRRPRISRLAADFRQIHSKASWPRPGQRRDLSRRRYGHAHWRMSCPAPSTAR